MTVVTLSLIVMQNEAGHGILRQILGDSLVGFQHLFGIVLFVILRTFRFDEAETVETVAPRIACSMV